MRFARVQGKNGRDDLQAVGHTVLHLSQQHVFLLEQRPQGWLRRRPRMTPSDFLGLGPFPHGGSRLDQFGRRALRIHVGFSRHRRPQLGFRFAAAG
jgi:hypothetical protein